MISQFHYDESLKSLNSLINGTTSGSQFLFKECDEKFTDEDLNEEGSKFTSDYYKNNYFGDYIDYVDPDDQYETIYDIPETDNLFLKVSKILDENFDNWKAQQ